mmetsp:Transcript_5991/g.7374  ORF Transcript_5991/g.7374 Transcript_5991/m.7374 type:complete len:266 (+) Transcript_5991:48-845(+)|eukprot:CAMPEP_0114337246 /NCGR_PEP_ID=MMETSP0101-20121206/6237_1 /TAXON_ID=38822 ORGANISM="Pteridomonas danica, Strain PT" /NCGR_SAMPLE_ID=MMETSP0101 /ASSEMBLY_ACC=CAM_ASM_000211 /LENGTH=265 /DNA_ID=CAMNT_0001469421 /DNA_START=252 /DNA_END=1049 /DNA_ORIENTATION=-
MTDEETLKQRMELPMRRSDMEAFAAEERRLWRIAQQDMPKAERFHILNAFSLQLERVEAEWGAHEQQMATDFQARKRAIEGRDQDVEKSVVHAPVGRWKSKEKQSRLIHTAPIQEPSTPNIPSTTPCSEHSQSSTVGVRSSQSRSEIENQLRELERSFGAAKMRMEFEKQIAIGFIHRQSLRMNCQIDSMAKWKDKIAQHLEMEESVLDNLKLRIECFCELMIESGCLPVVLRATTPAAEPSRVEYTAKEPTTPKLSLPKLKPLN